MDGARAKGASPGLRAPPGWSDFVAGLVLSVGLHVTLLLMLLRLGLFAEANPTVAVVRLELPPPEPEGPPPEPEPEAAGRGEAGRADRGDVRAPTGELSAAELEAAVADPDRVLDARALDALLAELDDAALDAIARHARVLPADVMAAVPLSRRVALQQAVMREAQRRAAAAPPVPAPTAPPPETKPQVEPVPAPETPPETPPEPLAWQKFVRTDAPTDVSRAAPAEFMSSHDRVAQAKRARTPVLSPETGPSPSIAQTRSSAPSPTRAEVRAGDRRARGGLDREDERKQEAIPEVAVGRDGEGEGEGASGRDGEAREGGPAAATSPAPPVRVALAIAGGESPPTVAETPEGDRADRPSPSEGEAWWQPTAVRLDVVPAPEIVIAETPRKLPRRPRKDVVAIVDKPGERDGEGGTDRPDADDEQAPARGVTTDEPPVEKPPEVVTAPPIEPVDDLREALGWGPLDRSELKPRKASAGHAGESGTPAMSAQTVLSDDVPIESVVLVDAQSTELGRYTEEIYQILQRNWYALDLPAQQKALGVQGTVTVAFRIHRNGRVSDVNVTRSSGVPELDALAVASIPKKLPPIPASLAMKSVLQLVTFTYRNPLFSASGTP